MLLNGTISCTGWTFGPLLLRYRVILGGPRRSSRRSCSFATWFCLHVLRCRAILWFLMDDRRSISRMDTGRYVFADVLCVGDFFRERGGELVPAEQLYHVRFDTLQDRPCTLPHSCQIRASSSSIECLLHLSSSACPSVLCLLLPNSYRIASNVRKIKRVPPWDVAEASHVPGS